MKTISTIGDLGISDYTNAKLMVDKSTVISASLEKVWGVLQDLKSAGDWLPSVKKVVSTDTSHANDLGVGAKRTVLYGIKETIEETVVYAEKHSILAYQIAFPSMVKEHLTVIQLNRRGADQTEVRIVAFFTPISFTGLLMKYGVYSMIIKSSLKKLRNLCERTGI